MAMANGNIDVIYHYVFAQQEYGKRIDLPSNAFTKYKKIWVIIYIEQGSNAQWIYPFQFNADNNSGNLWLVVPMDKLPFSFFAILVKDTEGGWNVSISGNSVRTEALPAPGSENFFVTRMYNDSTDYFAPGSEIVVIAEKDN